MKNIMKKILISGFIIFSLIFSSGIFSESVYAGCIDNDTGEWMANDCEDDKKVSNLAKNGINVFIGIIGFLAVVVVIYGGFLMVTSEGDAGKVKKAKDTILYGVVGLIVAMMAFGIVKFAVDNVINGTNVDKNSETNKQDKNKKDKQDKNKQDKNKKDKQDKNKQDKNKKDKNKKGDKQDENNEGDK